MVCHNTHDKLPRFLLLIGVMLTLGSWYYCYGVLVPAWKSDDARFGLTWANRSDLYPRWRGTRELLLHHRDPYSPEVRSDIQAGYYGRPVGEGYTADPQGFAYPLYVVWLLAPTMWASFYTVKTAFTILLFLATAVSVPLWFRALGIRASSSDVLLTVLFVLGSWPVVQGLAVQQLTLLVGFFLAAAMAAFACYNLRLCGVLLALATIKPQLSLPLIAWLTVWSCARWHQRRVLVWSWCLTMAALLLSAEAAFPGWLWRWKASWSTYLKGTNARLSLQILLGKHWGLVVTVLLIMIVAVMCTLRVHEEPGFPALTHCHTLVAATTLAAFPTWYMDGYNQVLLIPAVLWIVFRPDATPPRPAVRVLQLAGLSAVFWPTFATFGLTLVTLLRGRTGLSFQLVLRLPAYDFVLIPVLTIAALILNFPVTHKISGTGKASVN